MGPARGEGLQANQGGAAADGSGWWGPSGVDWQGEVLQEVGWQALPPIGVGDAIWGPGGGEGSREVGWPHPLIKPFPQPQ